MFENLAEIAASLPWWIGAGLALVSYGGLHYVATMPNVFPGDLKGMGAFAGRQLWITFAGLLQYLIPGALAIGVVVSAFSQHRRRALHGRVVAAPTRAALEGMSWVDFETVVGEAFRRKGFEVRERGGRGPDGGVDLELRLGDDKYLVQCKQWRTRQVGVAVVRELYGAMAAEGAVGGFVVASGDFTDEARSFAAGRAIELVATQGLLSLMMQTQEPATPIDRPAVSVPLCPKCAGEMVLRTATKGSNAGKPFWGCARFPGCRGTRTA